ncbi:LysR family transcriptional regulator [Paradevosia shaoguanensis]|uniref:LysR family transcriptional regulator n=1 Tax=Paradevosia shaoguanensis TaxID=1335043 RepID=UPI0019319F90|nr:LysR family transcriptional regulator [Paradevosia shaoguanensis]
MTLEQLRVFVAVAERQHVTRAAAALNMTQSTASAALAALESRHGTRLFDRVGRGLALNDAGRTLLPYAREVLLAANRAEEALSDLAGLRRGTLRIGASQTVASYWLPQRMVRFSEMHPLIDLTLEVQNTSQVAAAVLSGEADLGLVEGPVRSPELEVTPIATDSLALVAAASHPLAGRDVGLDDLRGERWVMREMGSGTRQVAEESLKRLGFAPGEIRIALELPSNEAVISAVRTGGLLTVLSEVTVAAALATGTLVRLPIELSTRSFSLVTHRERQQSQAAQAFARMLLAGT